MHERFISQQKPSILHILKGVKLPLQPLISTANEKKMCKKCMKNNFLIIAVVKQLVFSLLQAYKRNKKLVLRIFPTNLIFNQIRDIFQPYIIISYHIININSK